MDRPNRFGLCFASLILLAIGLAGSQAGAAEQHDTATATLKVEVRYGTGWFDRRYRSELTSLRHYASKTTTPEALAKLAALRERIVSRFGFSSLESAAVINEQGHAFVLNDDYGQAERNYSQVAGILKRLANRQGLKPVAHEAGHSPAETDSGGLHHARREKLSDLLAEITLRYRKLGLMADALMNELFNKSAFPKSIRDLQAPTGPQMPLPERAAANISVRNGGAIETEPPEYDADPAADIARSQDRQTFRRKASLRKRRTDRYAQRVYRPVAPPDPYEYRYEPRPYYPYDSSRYWRPLRSVRR